MNRIWLIFAFIGLMLGTVSCSKNDDDKGGEIEETDIIGKWVATSGEYNLSLDVTSSGYYFSIGKPGKGGVTDSGTYEISSDGKIVFENPKTGDVLAMGYFKNGKLTLTFVNSIAIIMLGNGAANVVFTLSDEEPDDEDEADKGFLVVQNLSTGNNVVAIKFYDEDNNLIETDTDVLEPDYQFTYNNVEVGTYSVEVKDSKGKSYKSKSFKVIKGKYTVLAYNGSALNVLATGVNESDLTRAAANTTMTKCERVKIYR